MKTLKNKKQRRFICRSTALLPYFFFYLYVNLLFQGFLSDLLEKANRHYDEQKLQEYTQTIVRLSH